jgi:hypothetical protein
MNAFLPYRWLHHLLFWAASFGLLLNLLAYNDDLEKVDYIYTALFHLGLLVIVYTNLLWLIPEFLVKNRYGLYLLLTLPTLAVGVFVHQFTYRQMAGDLFPNYYFTTFQPTWQLSGIMASYLVLTTLLYMAKSWIAWQQREKAFISSEKEQQQAELQALKSQIQPHFMMNNLNNLYGMALANHPHTAATILKLSESLQYLLYQTGTRLVALEDEVTFLKKYIQLERIRTDYPEQIQESWEGEIGQQQIAPLVLLPLVENAFKHGMKAADRQPIRIECRAGATELVLTVTNPKQRSQVALGREETGLGLANLRRRLNLLYPGRHQLRLHDQPETFTAQLQIPFS